MTTAAQTALQSGLATLTTQLGRGFRFGAATFTALAGAPATRRGAMQGTDLSVGLEFDVVLEFATSDLATLPSAGDSITDTATGEVLLVSGAPMSFGHLTTLYCRRQVSS